MESENQCIELFRHLYGSDPEWIASAPGRVNLIGEHTDYSGGFVFPAAINRRVTIAASRTSAPTTIWSSTFDTPARFRAAGIELGAVKDWGEYPAGVAWALQSDGNTRLPELQAAVVSDLPQGAGVSSSAAIEMAFAVLWNETAGLGHSSKELALFSQKAENQFVGMNCGIMDQMASAMGQEGCALLIDTRSLELTPVKLPNNFMIVLCDTQTPRSLTASSYNTRRAECEQAAAMLGIGSLRDAVMGSWSTLPEPLSRRAKHVVTENQRCLDFAEALQNEDRSALGRLMHESHVSLRDDYEVSSRDLDAMVEAGRISTGCVGTRMTGAGFGGACVSLVEAEKVEDFTRSIQEGYFERTGRQAQISPCLASQGAFVRSFGS